MATNEHLCALARICLHLPVHSACVCVPDLPIGSSILSGGLLRRSVLKVRNPANNGAGRPQVQSHFHLFVAPLAPRAFCSLAQPSPAQEPAAAASILKYPKTVAPLSISIPGLSCPSC